MTAAHIVDPAGLLGEALSEASPDLMRSLHQTIILVLLSAADADAIVGAEYGRLSAARSSQRNSGGGDHVGADAVVRGPDGKQSAGGRRPSSRLNPDGPLLRPRRVSLR
jgi:hypothetical protein